MGFLDQEQVDGILEAQRESHLPLGQVLSALGLVSPEVLDRKLRLFLARNREDVG